MLKQKFSTVVYFFVKVVAMVTKLKAKIIFSDDIFPIISHISNTENLIILFAWSLVPKGLIEIKKKMWGRHAWFWIRVTVLVMI